MSFGMRTKRGNNRAYSVTEKHFGNIIVGDDESAIEAATDLRNHLEDLADTKTYSEILEDTTVTAISETFKENLEEFGFDEGVKGSCVAIIRDEEDEEEEEFSG